MDERELFIQNTMLSLRMTRDEVVKLIRLSNDSRFAGVDIGIDDVVSVFSYLIAAPGISAEGAATILWETSLQLDRGVFSANDALPLFPA